MSKQAEEKKPTAAEETAEAAQISTHEIEEQDNGGPANRKAVGQEKSANGEPQAPKGDGQLELVKRLIEKLSAQLTSEEHAKGTLGDLLKLMQLEKELAPQEEEREIIVRWVAPWDE